MNREQRRAAQRAGRKTRSVPVPAKCCLLQVTPAERRIRHAADCPATTSPTTVAGKAARLAGLEAVKGYVRRLGWQPSTKPAPAGR